METLTPSVEDHLLLLEYFPLAITIHCEGKICYANTPTADLLGVDSPADLIGRDLLDFFHPESKDKTLSVISSFDHSPKSPAFEIKLIKPNGKVIDVEVIGFPVLIEGKRAVQVIIKDISKIKKVQKKIKVNEMLLNQLFSNSPVGIVLLDEKNKIMKTNAGFEGIFGYKEEEIKRKDLNRLIVPRDQWKIGLEANNEIRKGSFEYLETYRINKEGEKVPVLIYGVPVEVDGSVIGIYGIYIDISYKIETEETLRIRNEELDTFTSKVSHDLRAPLNSLTGLINLIKATKDKNEKELLLEKMQNSVDKLDNFIVENLKYSKSIDTSLKNELIDFEKLIEHIFDDLQYYDGIKDIDKIIEVEGGSYCNDPIKIEDIFRNILSNSVKYHDPKKKSRFIKVFVKNNDERARIIVEDNGIGIKNELVPNIYDMFFRGTADSKGTGLGLHLVKKAVQKLNGEINIQSKEGEGTIVELSLPNLS